ncbi:hypothetical protein BDV36DRAFT_298799 [Aspergillus pseudocaelatus]|uniref:Transcription factor domain-containing protein n=1 Tax=Aspergillus pseudocaelatus TaxID=1825620 RepID=A0ABQ6WC17_9EURO|nr:hypothetical protein BDV36DRAFT_298799 [Aspergillus pseudocaelatus]
MRTKPAHTTTAAPSEIARKAPKSKLYPSPPALVTSFPIVSPIAVTMAAERFWIVTSKLPADPWNERGTVDVMKIDAAAKVRPGPNVTRAIPGMERAHWFYPGREPTKSEHLHAKLTNWKAELVPTLTWDPEVLESSNPFSMSLSVQYNHHLILIYLGHMRGENTCNLDEQEIEEIVDGAAHHIPTVVCALATKYALLTVPHELYHGIFLAQAAFYERMRSPNKLVARLGRSALNSCQVVLQAISEFWDSGTFYHAAESGGLGIAEASGVSGTMNSANEAGVFNALLGEDRWQGNPMLERLFDLPPELFLPE